MEDEASTVDNFALIKDDNVDIKDEVVVIDSVVVDVSAVCPSTNT